MIAKILLIFIIILGFLVRLYKIDSPIADWHSWRQADTAAVSRNFIREGFNIFYPKGDDMTGIAENPIPNLGHYRFVEFPIYNMAVYPIYLIFGVADKYSRLVSVFFSLGSIFLLYLITKKYLDTKTALLGAFIFATLPFSVFYSRTTLPEPTFIFFALGMIYFVDSFIWEKKFFHLAFIFTAVAFLIKPWAIFFAIPLIYSLLKKDGKIRKNYILFFSFALIPFILWRLWILQHPEGIPASNWLLDGDHLRYRPAFWWWIISERIGREILGVTGAFLFFLGLIFRPKDGNWFLHIWALSMFAYFIIFATGNVRHDYYQVIFTPIASIFLARGFIELTGRSGDFIARVWRLPLACAFLLLTFYFTWTQVKELYKVNNPPIIEAGQYADKILPKDAVVVAPYNGDTAFLYQINRSGWPITVFSIPEMVANYGATHYVSVNKDDQTNWVLRHFKILEDNPKFVIADLRIIEKPLDPKDPQP